METQGPTDDAAGESADEVYVAPRTDELDTVRDPVDAIVLDEEGPAPKRRRRWLLVALILIGIAPLCGWGGVRLWTTLAGSSGVPVTADDVASARGPALAALADVYDAAPAGRALDLFQQADTMQARAEEHYAHGAYADAKQAYQQVQTQCRQVQACIKAAERLAAAGSVRLTAEQAGAADDASELWSQAEQAFAEARDEFGRDEFENAYATLTQAAETFEQAAASARNVALVRGKAVDASAQSRAAAEAATARNAAVDAAEIWATVAPKAAEAQAAFDEGRFGDAERLWQASRQAYGRAAREADRIAGLRSDAETALNQAKAAADRAGSAGAADDAGDLWGQGQQGVVKGQVAYDARLYAEAKSLWDSAAPLYAQAYDQARTVAKMRLDAKTTLAAAQQAAQYAAQQPPRTETRDLVNQADQLIVSGQAKMDAEQYEPALGDFKGAVAAYDKARTTAELIDAAKLARTQAQAARQAIKGTPTDEGFTAAQTSFRRGETAFTAGRHAEAVEAWTAAKGGFFRVRQALLAKQAALWYEQARDHVLGRNGTQVDAAKAAQFYLKAAEAGHAKAMRETGWLYQNGRGVTKDLTKAARWYQAAVDAGSVVAMVDLGVMYSTASGVQRDYAKAIALYRQAAEAGNVHGMRNLGNRYRYGTGVDRDYAKALKWYRKASEAGLGSATNEIGTLYHSGFGVTQNYSTAMHWYRRAGDAGDANGMRNVGLLYEKGQGVRKSVPEAVLWYRKAADAGNASAAAALKGLGRRR